MPTRAQALALSTSVWPTSARSVVAKAIIAGGIAADRVVTKSMGDDMYQPYIDPIQNRVAICVAE